SRPTHSVLESHAGLAIPPRDLDRLTVLQRHTAERHRRRAAGIASRDLEIIAAVVMVMTLAIMLLVVMCCVVGNTDTGGLGGRRIDDGDGRAAAAGVLRHIACRTRHGRRSEREARARTGTAHDGRTAVVLRGGAAQRGVGAGAARALDGDGG